MTAGQSSFLGRKRQCELLVFYLGRDPSFFNCQFDAVMRKNEEMLKQKLVVQQLIVAQASTFSQAYASDCKQTTFAKRVSLANIEGRSRLFANLDSASRLVMRQRR